MIQLNQKGHIEIKRVTLKSKSKHKTSNLTKRVALKSNQT